MAPVRIVLAFLPTLTADAFAAIVAGDPGLLCVGDLDADVAIVSCSLAGLATEAAPLLRERPELVVLGVDPSDGATSSIRVRSHGRPGAAELQALLRALGAGE